MIGLIIILVFPFIFFYTQINNLNQKTGAIKKAMDEGKETYTDTINMCERWTETGEQVYNTVWHYCKTHPEQDAIDGDQVLMGLKTYRVYKNYSKEKFIKHIQWQKDHDECWCYERVAFNEKEKNLDFKLKYHMTKQFFYRLRFDFTTHHYYIWYNGSDKKEIIDYDTYKKLGGTDSKDKAKEYKK